MLTPLLFAGLCCFLLFPVGNSKGLDNNGKEFIIPCLENYRIERNMKLYITTLLTGPVSVTLSTPGFNSWGRSFNVSWGGFAAEIFDTNLCGRGNELAHRAIYVLAQQEVACYLIAEKSYSMDGTNVLPIDSLGKEYYLTTYKNLASFAIGGIYANTQVTIIFQVWRSDIPNPDLHYFRNTYGSTTPLQFVLHRFQVQYFSENGNTDLTGTNIRTDKAVIVLAGNRLTKIPNNDLDISPLSGRFAQHNNEKTSRDFMMSVLYPFNVWGKLFYTFNVPSRKSLVLRILAARQNTVITIQDTGTGDTTLTLNSRRFKDYDVPSGNVMTIRSNNAIMVVIYMKTLAYDETMGDPSFTPLPPAALYASDYAFNTGEYFKSQPQNAVAALVLIINGSFRSGLRLDDEPMVVVWTVIPGSGGFITGHVVLDIGYHTVYHVDPTKTFLAVLSTSGLGSSWLFELGRRMTSINEACTAVPTEVGDILDNDCDGVIDEETDNGIDDDGDGIIDEDLAAPPRVFGNWGEWSAFRKCPLVPNCRKQRIRKCDNPPPSNGGKPCTGSPSENIICNQQCDICLNGVQQSGLCVCFKDDKKGYWGSELCDRCLDGYALPNCDKCAEGWTGAECTLRCENGVLDLSTSAQENWIIPQFTCQKLLSKSYAIAWLGYNSFKSTVWQIDVGENNSVTGSTAVSQETLFRPGSHEYAFYVGPYRKGHHVSWNLTAGINHNLIIPHNVTQECDEAAHKYDLREATANQVVGVCRCDKGFHGTSCTQSCLGDKNNICSNRGTCSKINGKCICSSKAVGTEFDFRWYTQGYALIDKDYLCSQCTTDFYGDDCSTARLSRSVKGDGFYSVLFSSEIITLDGATMTLVQPGAYRLLNVGGLTMEGFFVACRGRYDCHALREVAVKYKSFTISFAVDTQGISNISYSDDGEVRFPLSYKRGAFSVEKTVDDILRYKLKAIAKIMLANVEGNLLLGVTLAKDVKDVTGLLGNADHQWFNDISREPDYYPEGASAEQKAMYANEKFKLKDRTILLQSSLREQHSSCGFALKIQGNSVGGRGAILTLPSMSKFSLELWTKISNVDGTTAVLLSMNTTLGTFVLSVNNKVVRVTWGSAKRMFSSVTVQNDTWTYVCINWMTSKGEMTATTIPMVKTNQMIWILGEHKALAVRGFHTDKNLDKIRTVSVGGEASNTVVFLEYIRLFENILVILFDEGVGIYYGAFTYDNVVNGKVGSGVSWPYSTVPLEDILVTEELPLAASDKKAVTACAKELQQSGFKSKCQSYAAIRQLIMESCITDYMRSNKPRIEKLSGSAFAYYCHGVSKVQECNFISYLDFCQSPEARGVSMTYIALMALAALPVLGIAVGCFGYFFYDTSDEDDVVMEEVFEEAGDDVLSGRSIDLNYESELANSVEAELMFEIEEPIQEAKPSVLTFGSIAASIIALRSLKE